MGALKVLEKYKELGAFDLFYNDLEKNFIKKFYLNILYLPVLIICRIS